MIGFRTKTKFHKTEAYLDKLATKRFIIKLEKYGDKGVEALSKATPVRTGATAAAWSYKIVQRKDGSFSIVWTNSNAPYGVPVAILIQYGHRTNGGGYVQGIDYINPALKPIFEAMLKEIEGEVKRP